MRSSRRSCAQVRNLIIGSFAARDRSIQLPLGPVTTTDQGNHRAVVGAPANSHVAPPGYYVLFVLDALLQRGLPDRVMLTAFGPGFTCAALTLDRA